MEPIVRQEAAAGTAGASSGGSASQEGAEARSVYARCWDDYVKHWRVHNPDGQRTWPGDEWGSRPQWEGLFQREFIAFGVQEWSRAVEIGPGSGKYTAMVLASSRAEVRGYDISPVFLQVCEQRCAESIREGRLALRLVEIDRADGMLADLRACGWERTVDALYSIDAMVHVDLQHLIVYLLTASAVLRPGGKLILSLANATSPAGFRKLLENISWTWSQQGGPSGKFEWLSPDLVQFVLSSLGFRIELLDVSGRDIHLVASLADPGVAEHLQQYLHPRDTAGER